MFQFSALQSYKSAFSILFIFLTALALSSCFSNTSMHCLRQYHDKEWALLRFSNSCSSTINTVICTKNSTAEIIQLFGGDRAQWSCTRTTARSGQSAGSTIWSSEKSSLFTQAVSSSRYVIAACYAPTKPYFEDNPPKSFRCK